MDGARSIVERAFEDGAGRGWFADAPASPGLRHCVRGYCAYAERTPRFTTRREMPTTRGFVILNLGAPISLTGGDGAHIPVGTGEAFVAGMHTSPALSHSSGGQEGIHVWLSLGALHALLRQDMAALGNKVVKLADLWGAPAASLGERLGNTEALPARLDLLEAALAGRMPPPSAAERVVDWAEARLRRAPALPIADLAAETGWSGRHFASQFRRRIGIGPRRFARLVRFERLVADLRAAVRPDWADLAAAHGFADQPHLVREVREFSGLAPGALHARMLPGGGFVEG